MSVSKGPNYDRQQTVLIRDVKRLDDDAKEAEAKPAALVVVSGEHNGAVHDLSEEKAFSVGRSIDNDLPMEYDEISRYHFSLKRIENEGTTKWVIVDNNSTNGTSVEEEVVENQRILNNKEVISVGPHRFKFLEAGEVERLTYEKLHYEAHHDGHTGCFNKAFFNRKIDLEVRRSKQTSSPLSVIMLDIDHFKKFNDTYGHDAGDYVLKELATLISENIRKSDVIFARYGGEEFVILLSKTKLEEARHTAERLRKLIEAHDFVYAEKQLSVTASFGVAIFRKDVIEDGTELFKSADKALYLAKDSGRNQVKCDSDL